jgi:hypothetical protein
MSKMRRIVKKKSRETPALKEMVQEAIMALMEPGDIKKYIAAKHNVHSDTLSPAIAKYLKRAVP